MSRGKLNQHILSTYASVLDWKPWAKKFVTQGLQVSKDRSQNHYNDPFEIKFILGLD